MENWGNKIKKIWNKLTLVSKIVFILWTIDAFYILISGKSGINFFQWVIIWIFASFLFVGIAQLISKRKKSKVPKNKVLAPTDSLPIIMGSNLLLGQGEVCHYYGSATFVKTKNVVVGYSGGSRGTSIRIAKGVSFRVGASKAAPVRGDVQERTKGILSVTNKRIVFSANKGAFDKKISSLSAVTPYQNSIAFQFGDHQYSLETVDASYIHQIINRIVNTPEDINNARL